MTAWVGPTIARPSAKTHQKAATTHSLRQQINAEHPGGAEREVREPISERRADIWRGAADRARPQASARDRRAARHKTASAPPPTAPPAPAPQARTPAADASATLRCKGGRKTSSLMIPKSGNQFRTRSCSKQNPDRDPTMNWISLGHSANSVASEAAILRPRCSHYEAPKANRKTALPFQGSALPPAPGMTPCSKRLERCA